MNRTLILIEDDTSNKIPALFDGYSFHQQNILRKTKKIRFLRNQKLIKSFNQISVLEQAN